MIWLSDKFNDILLFIYKIHVKIKFERKFIKEIIML
jgi:hypothetical protein